MLSSFAHAFFKFQRKSRASFNLNSLNLSRTLILKRYPVLLLFL
jgi:hypothetical protein